jgi:glycogen debranching enzyme
MFKVIKSAISYKAIFIQIFLIAMNDDVKKRLIKNLHYLRMNDGLLFAGLPRFPELFGRDSIITAWELFYMDRNLLKNTIHTLSRYQGKIYDYSNGEEPGKILHEFYPSYVAKETGMKEKGDAKWLKPDTPFYFSVDSTPLWLSSFSFFMDTESGKDFIRNHRNSILSALKWILNRSNKNGLLTYNRSKYGHGIAGMNWTDGAWELYKELKGEVATIEVQGYSIDAMTTFLEITKIIGADECVSEAKERIKRVKRNIDLVMWNEKTDYPYNSLDEYGNIVGSVTSNPGHLLSVKEISYEMGRKIADRLFQDDMFTPYGIRTLSSEDPNFNPLAYQLGSIWFQDNWLILRGLKLRGFNGKYNKLKNALLNAIQCLNEAFEYFSVDNHGNIVEFDKLKVKPCSPQAWTVGAMLNVLDSD